jgi:spore coat protein U-like protein
MGSLFFELKRGMPPGHPPFNEEIIVNCRQGMTFLKMILMIRIAALILISIFWASLATAAETNLITVTATVISKSQCKFNTSASNIDFGNLDPANPVDKTVNTTITFRCGGSAPNATFLISDDDGLYETGSNANRMRHSTNSAEYLPYTLTLSPVSGTVPKNSDQTLTITGKVKGSDYEDAIAGSFSDSVVISINP